MKNGGRIFLSYRRTENPLALSLLRDRLQEQFGRDRVFFDQESIATGEGWKVQIDSALDHADVVVMVYGRAWRGERVDDQPARIHDPDDMVRYELVRARQLGLRIEPVTIDLIQPPDPATLPKDLEFLSTLQFRHFDLRDSVEQNINQLVLHLKRVLFGQTTLRRLTLQATWMGGACAAAVWLLQGASLLQPFLDGFDRQVQRAEASSLSNRIPDDRIAVVNIEADDYRRHFHSQSPLDPGKLAALFETLEAASRDQGTCRPTAPIGVALDFAPSADRASSSQYTRLNRAITQLARCRPLVLACPGIVTDTKTEESDYQWLAAISGAAPAAGAPEYLKTPSPTVLFASNELDSLALRMGQQRTDLGTVVGALASGVWTPEFARDHLETNCACTSTKLIETRCTQGSSESTSTWDHQSLLKLRSTHGRSFSRALNEPTLLAQFPVIMIGGAFGNQDRIPMPFKLPGFGDVLHGSQLHASHAYTAMQAGPHQRTSDWTSKAFALLGTVSLATAVSLASLLSWRRVIYNPQRYSQRLLGYLTFLTLILFLPLMMIGLASEITAFQPIAAVAALAVAFAVLRSAIAGFEMAINRGIDWRPFDLPGLWQAFKQGRKDATSAWLRLTVVGFEAALMLLALMVVFK